MLIALGVEDALARVIHNEAGIAAEVELYHDEQEKFFEEHFTHENVHHFSTAALPLLGPAAKEHTKDVDADGNLNMLGYKMIVLTRQSAHADGGEKDWMANGVLSHGHALLAWPAQPGVTGRLAYMSGPDGALYERAVSGHDAALLDGIARAFDPAPEWKKTFTPIKGVKPAIPHSYFKPASPVADELEF